MLQEADRSAQEPAARLEVKLRIDAAVAARHPCSGSDPVLQEAGRTRPGSRRHGLRIDAAIADKGRRKEINGDDSLNRG